MLVGCAEQLDKGHFERAASRGLSLQHANGYESSYASAPAAKANLSTQIMNPPSVLLLITPGSFVAQYAKRYVVPRDGKHCFSVRCPRACSFADFECKRASGYVPRFRLTSVDLLHYDSVLPLFHRPIDTPRQERLPFANS